MKITSESVSYGHPDRMCDTISNFLLDAYLTGDKYSHCGIECLANKDEIIVSGEVKSNSKVDIAGTVKSAIKFCGYDDYSPRIVNQIYQQSSEICSGVDNDGAGDQGIIFGYASKDTQLGLDVPTAFANLLTFRYQEYTKINSLFKPDAKSQVTYDTEDGSVVIIFAASHSCQISLKDVRKEILENVINPVFALSKTFGVKSINRVIINGTGTFTIYGPTSDCGVTGRKLAVDSYGGQCAIGGGNTNGKDPTKVDASAARAARNVALKIVEYGDYEWAKVCLSYCIGLPEPIDVTILTNKGVIDSKFDFSVKNIIEYFDLRNQKYYEITRTGQFGLYGIELFNQLKVDSNTEFVVPSWEKI